MLTDPATYRLDPAEAWRRFKVAEQQPQLLALVRELAAWRETAAQQRNLPRNRLLRDESLLEIAAHAPTTVDDLARTRGLGKSFAEGKLGGEILAAVDARPRHAGKPNIRCRRRATSRRRAWDRWSICCASCSSCAARRTTWRRSWSPTPTISR